MESDRWVEFLGWAGVCGLLAGLVLLATGRRVRGWMDGLGLLSFVMLGALSGPTRDVVVMGLWLGVTTLGVRDMTEPRGAERRDGGTS